MKNYLTIKLRYFLEWILRHTIQNMEFDTQEHGWFVDNRILVVKIFDKLNGQWIWAFGKLKPEERTEKIGKNIHIIGLGGGMWSKIFGDWFVCIYRGIA